MTTTPTATSPFIHPRVSEPGRIAKVASHQRFPRVSTTVGRREAVSQDGAQRSPSLAEGSGAVLSFSSELW
jgi:hypothetical protein